MFNTKLRVGDKVAVVAGKDKGVEGEIESFDRKKNRVMVKGANLFKKHMKADVNNPESGIVEKQKSIHLSNVMLVDPNSGKPTRVGYKIEADGKKVRIAKNSKTVL